MRYQWQVVLVATVCVVSVDATPKDTDCAFKHDFTSDEVIPVKVMALDFDHTATIPTASYAEELLYKATKTYRHGDRQVIEHLDKEWEKLFFHRREYENDLTTTTLNRLIHSKDEATLKVQELLTYLLKMDQIHKDMVKDIVDSKMLKGITTDGLYTIAQQVRLCPGLLNTLRRFEKQSIHVISAGLSRRFIQINFKENGAPTNLIVHASEIPFRYGRSTGDIIPALTSFDKERILGELIRAAADKKGYSIFVGDSYVDLLALLKADIGILINYTDEFLNLVHAFGIKTRPVGDWRKLVACWKESKVKLQPVIYTAQSWVKIGDFVFGQNF